MSSILTGEVFTPDFQAGGHLYFNDSRPIPSVSRILRPLTQAVYGAIDPAVLQRAADFGTAVHSCTELLDEDDLDEGSVAPEWRPYLDAYRAWKRDMRPEIDAIELRLACAKYAGTLDRLCRIDGDHWVVDLKTTSEIHPHVGVQLAAYEALASAKFGHSYRRAAVQLRADGTYRFKEFKKHSDETCFSALLGIYYWGQTNGY